MEQARSIESFGSDDSNSSGISWSAVIAGAFLAAALSLALLALGAGLASRPFHRGQILVLRPERSVEQPSFGLY